MCEAAQRTEAVKLTQLSEARRAPAAALRAKAEAAFAEQLRTLSASSDIAEHDLGYCRPSGASRPATCGSVQRTHGSYLGALNVGRARSTFAPIWKDWLARTSASAAEHASLAETLRKHANTVSAAVSSDDRYLAASQQVRPPPGLVPSSMLGPS